MNPAQWQLEAVVRFWRFVAERHEVFRRRVLLRQPPPWTTDLILQRVYFTNIYRELDRATRYLVVSLQDAPYLTAADRLLTVIAYRFFTRPATYTLLGGPWTVADWKRHQAQHLRTLEDAQRDGWQIFTGAFNISNHGDVRPKVQVVMEQIAWAHQHIQSLLQAVQSAPTLEAAHTALLAVPGFAGFMAYEVLIDLCYPEIGVVHHSLDEWVYVGPGALRGLQTLVSTTKVQRRHGLSLVSQLRDEQHRVVQAEGIPLNGPPLTLEAVEQALCEWQKYCRAQTDGRAKRTYAPAVANPDLRLWEHLPACFTDPNQWVGTRRRTRMT